MDAFPRSRPGLMLLVLGATLLSQFPLSAAPQGASAAPARPAAAPSLKGGNTTVQTFVILFRQGSRTLTDAEKQRRTEETGAWARGQNAAGHKLDPRILAPESAQRGAEVSGAVKEGASLVTALLFLEAHDLAEAARVAESHPALRYGASVEVRPWASPVPVTPAPPAP